LVRVWGCLRALLHMVDHLGLTQPRRPVQCGRGKDVTLTEEMRCWCLDAGLANGFA
jgi:hypothetical protein